MKVKTEDSVTAASGSVRRSKRQKVEVSYTHMLSSDDEEDLCLNYVQQEPTDSPYRSLVDAVLKWPESPTDLTVLSAEDLPSYIHSTGFRTPCVVRRATTTPGALGISLPRGKITVKRLAKLVGLDHPVQTVDVATQLEGPIYSMDEWVSYFLSPPPRKPLLNVVSLALSDTPLRDMITVPSVVKELDLARKAWPHNDSCGPEVQLYALMSVANCYTDFHIDFGGSSVWYHVLSGQKVFLLVPPSKGNLIMFEEWASSEKQGSVFFAERADGCQKVELMAGDTLFIPGGWPHSVATPVDSLVVGGNFLTGYNLSLQLEIWHMEERLKVRRKFRYPMFKSLMWHTASYYLDLLKKKDKKKISLSSWEREGLLNLWSCLQSWLQQSTGEVPGQIENANSLLKDLKSYITRAS